MPPSLVAPTPIGNLGSAAINQQSSAASFLLSDTLLGSSASYVHSASGSNRSSATSTNGSVLGQNSGSLVVQPEQLVNGHNAYALSQDAASSERGLGSSLPARQEFGTHWRPSRPTSVRRPTEDMFDDDD